MTRRQAYRRLALIALGVWSFVAFAASDVGFGAVLAAVVLATGALGIELGSRRRRPPESDDRER